MQPIKVQMKALIVEEEHQIRNQVVNQPIHEKGKQVDNELSFINDFKEGDEKCKQVQMN